MAFPVPFIFAIHHPATTDIYTLSLHDALPISYVKSLDGSFPFENWRDAGGEQTPAVFTEGSQQRRPGAGRSEEHTSELQSRQYLVCRLLLEKKKQQAVEVGTR